MLCYLGTGSRHYGLHPVRAYRRPYWEFQAVLQGSISLVHENGPDLLRKKHLWLCSPQFSHGWTGAGKESAEVVVFHFLSLPEPLNQYAAQQGYITLPLTDAQCDRLHQLAQGAQHFWKRPAPGMLLYHQHLMLELCWLVYSATHPASLPTESSKGRRPEAGKSHANALSPQSSGHERVHTALRWFQVHLTQNPSLDQVAHAVGLSTSQLRRLFQEHMNASPKKIFDQLRFQYALELMGNPECKLSTVSEACGFTSASAFSRAFKHKFGTSPDKWRG